jgi:hypothetical protein
VGYFLGHRIDPNDRIGDPGSSRCSEGARNISLAKRGVARSAAATKWRFSTHETQGSLCALHYFEAADRIRRERFRWARGRRNSGTRVQSSSSLPNKMLLASSGIVPKVFWLGKKPGCDVERMIFSVHAHAVGIDKHADAHLGVVVTETLHEIGF